MLALNLVSDSMLLAAMARETKLFCRPSSVPLSVVAFLDLLLSSLPVIRQLTTLRMASVFERPATFCWLI